MKVSDMLSSGGPAFPSLEIVPPPKGMTRAELMEGIRPFMEFRPRYINVTCHRDQFEYARQADGSYTRRVVRRRISETAVCGAIQSEFKVEVVPHLICGGATAGQIENQLYDFRFMGIGNVMALRGDGLEGEKRFVPTPGGYAHADGLVAAIRSFEKETDTPGAFCIGVGGYPEKHFESPNPETDLQFLKQKVESGADYIITQMFFDNRVYYDFVSRCRAAGVTIPIIPGLKPLSSPRQVALLPETFSIDIPVELTSEIAARPEHAYEIGRAWCLAQCRDLLAHGVPAVHFFTMGRPDNILDILRACF